MADGASWNDLGHSRSRLVVMGSELGLKGRAVCAAAIIWGTCLASIWLASRLTDNGWLELLIVTGALMVIALLGVMLTRARAASAPRASDMFVVPPISRISMGLMRLGVWGAAFAVLWALPARIGWPVVFLLLPITDRTADHAIALVRARAAKPVGSARLGGVSPDLPTVT